MSATGSRKLVDLAQAEALVAAARQRGLRIAFTNGCFDLLHPGHELSLTQARQAADFLVVAINSDQSVKALKGPGRPVVSEGERALALCQLASVDCVIIFDEPDPMQLLRSLRPDVLVKGGDYDPARIVGAEFVASYGGEVRLTSYLKGVSTSLIIAGRETQQLKAKPPDPMQVLPEDQVRGLKAFDTMMTSHAETFRTLYLGARATYARDTDKLQTLSFHLGEFGRAREKVSQAFLRPLTPARLAIGDGFIVRPGFGVSRQCDIIVYDPTAAPFAGQQQLGLFFPIESVIAIGEIKSALSERTFAEAVEQLNALRTFCELDGAYPFSFLLFEKLEGTSNQRVDQALLASVGKAGNSATSSVYLSVADGLLYADKGEWLEPGDKVSHIKQFGVQYNQAVCKASPRHVDLSQYVYGHSDDVRHRVSSPSKAVELGPVAEGVAPTARKRKATRRKR